MKNIFITLILLLFVTNNFADNFKVDGIAYSVTSSTTVEVTSGGTYTGAINIPFTVTYDNLPYYVTSIASYAFSGCTDLTSVAIPVSVTDIGINVFSGCSGLDTITVEEANSRYCSVGGVLFNKEMTAILCYPSARKGSYIIPGPVKSIANYAFSGCNGLTSITFPCSVTSIENFAFADCSSLISVVIPKSVTSIGNFVFYGCNSLTSVSIPYSVTSINNFVFYGCAALGAVTIPGSVALIGDYAFGSCSGLRTIFANRISPVALHASSSSFDGVDKLQCVLYVPMGSNDAYQSAAVWRDFMNIVETDQTGVKEQKTIGFDVRVANKTIELINVNGNLLTLYDTTGRRVFESSSPRSVTQIILHQPGLYILKLDCYCKKILVR